MKKTTIEVEGMMCGMCEAHVSDAIRKNFDTKKVSASHLKKQAEVISNDSLDSEKLKKVIADLGYNVGKITEEEYNKKGIFSIFKK